MALSRLAANRCFSGRWMRFSHPSQALGCEMSFSAYVPDAASTQQLPVLFWLSGLTCTDENFVQKAGAARAAAEHGVILVCPDTSPRDVKIEGDDESYDFGTGAGFYLNATAAPWSSNYHMYDYVTQELPSLVHGSDGESEGLFPASTLGPAAQGVFGHSMGGHGALVCALKNPAMFRTVSAFAPICNPTACPWGVKAFNGYLAGGVEEGKQYDSTILAAGYSGPPLDILIDQGADDQFLLSDQLLPQNLVNACESSDTLNVTYREQVGHDHSYFFISSFIEDHITWHASRMAA